MARGAQVFVRSCLAVALVLISTPAAAAELTQQAVAPVSDAAGKNWSVYGGNLFNKRYSSLNQITPANVASLKGAWNYHIGSMNSATSFESSPLVIDGTLYLTGPQSQVYALDAKTGAEKWKYMPELTDIFALPLCCGQVNRGVGYGAGKIYVGQFDAKLVALDASTGQVVWSQQVDDPRAGYSETMAPLFWDWLEVNLNE